MSEFTKNIENSKWQNVYRQYANVLKAKVDKMKEAKKKELLELDKWYQNELPDLISGRDEKYISHSEICRLMTWKLTRGKFRPRLQQMVSTNSEDEVKAASLKAFKLLPNISAAIQALTVLKAIGPATASAVLAAGCQDVPFMADESVLALPGFASIDYNLKTYLEYTEEIREITRKLQKQDKGFNWTGHKVEITLWTHYLGNKLIPDFQEKLDTNNNESEPTEPIIKKRKT